MLKESYREWSSNKAPRLAAALAYYTLFAMAPLLVIVIQIGALILGRGQASGHHHQVSDMIYGNLRVALGEAGAKTVADIVQSTVDKQGQGWFSSIIGWIVLVVAAGGLFGALQEALNTVWEVPADPKAGWLKMVRERFVSFALIAGIALLLLVSLACNAVVVAMFPDSAELLKAINVAVILALATVLFAALFKFLPDVHIQWRDVWTGALLTALLFGLGQFLLQLYLAYLGSTSTYGAAGSLIVIMVWVYYSAQILLFGAEFTRVYANHRGSRPDKMVGDVAAA